MICQGDEAWTDGQRIVLPSLPEPMDDRLERMILRRIAGDYFRLQDWEQDGGDDE